MNVEPKELKGKEVLDFLERVLDICKLDCRTTFHADNIEVPKRLLALRRG